MSRQHDRAAVTGLSALIEHSPEGTTRRHEVLNVSEHGMLIGGLQPQPIDTHITFVLAGRGIDHAGHARVVHQTDTNAGVTVAQWDGAPSAIGALITDGAEFRSYVSDWH